MKRSVVETRGASGTRREAAAWVLTALLATTTLIAGAVETPARADAALEAPQEAAPSREMRLRESGYTVPNIVLIIGDDVGWTDFGFMGSESIRTPHLDRLAAGGTVFTHAFAPDSLCGPVQRALLTGLSPQAVARGFVRAARPRKPLPTLRAVFETLPERLSEQGYASFQGGKFFEGAFVDGGFTHGMTVDRKSASGEREPPRRGPAALVRGIGGRALGRETMEPLWAFLETHRNEPFFVWYAPMLPHLPFDAQPEFTRLYSDDLASVRGYRANLTRFDATVGQLLARLESLGLRERTLIVYLSDNGWDASPEGQRLGLGGPKGKGTIHELGVRTPLILSLPGVIDAGARDDRLVSLLDVYPTLLDFGHAPVPRVTGRSLHPLLTGTGDFHREFVIGGGGTDGRRSRYLRSEVWRYTSDEDLAEGLYMIEEDPREENNLAEARPELLRTLRAELLRRLPNHR